MHPRWSLALFASILLALFIPAARAQSKPLLPIVVNGKYGFIDADGKIVIQPKFYRAMQFLHGRAEVMICGENKWINERGEVIQIPAGGVGNPNGALTSFDFGNLMQEKWGVIDENYNLVLPAKYGEQLFFGSDGKEELASFHTGRPHVDDGEKYGFINRKGEVAIPARYASVGEFSGGLALVQVEEDGYYEYIDTKGNIAFPMKFKHAVGFSEGLAAVQVGKISPDEDFETSFLGQWGAIDHQGKWVVPPQFEILSSFSKGLAGFRGAHDLFGLIDTHGEIVIPAKFKSIGDFNDGRALAATPEGEVGYIDHEGKWVFPPLKAELDHYIATDAGDFGFIVISRTRKDLITGDDGWAYLAPSGKTIWRARWKYVPEWEMITVSDEQRQQIIHDSCQ